MSKVVIEIAIPIQDSPGGFPLEDAALAHADAILIAIGDAGVCIESGMGMGYRDLGIETDEPLEVCARARRVAPRGTEFSERPPEAESTPAADLMTVALELAIGLGRPTRRGRRRRGGRR